MLKEFLNDSFFSDFFYLIYKQSIFNVVICIMLSVIVVAVINNIFLLKNCKLRNIINIAVFSFSLSGILIFTLTRSESAGEISLIPFYTFFRIKNGGNTELFRSFYMNVLLFVPFGLGMPYVLSKRPHKRNALITIGFAAVLSAGIEFAQYYYHLGRCETDDVIANTLGAAVGTLSYLLYIRILKNREESLMNSKLTNSQKLMLDLSSKSLFGKEYNLPENYNCEELIEESVRQTVFPQIFSHIKENASSNANKLFSQIIAKNIRVEYAHNEVHKVLTDNDIPYIVLKGVASASYYKEPVLRMMGDVDILVESPNIEKVDMLLKSIGFVTNDNLDGDSMHIGYKRKDGISCEVHRRIGWTPNNSVGDIVNQYLSDIFEKSLEYKTTNGCCVVPSSFHHGLILLLHTATHLTHEGVGLRHLCDWAVFINGFSNDEFIETFEKPLKEMGLWRFAQLLTLCCIKYLGFDKKEWAGEAGEELLDGMITDILNGGNFGMKDADRYGQIKYISDRKSGETAKNGPVAQLFSSINQKTKKDFKFVNKSKIFLPIGWIFTVCKYFYLVIMGKRQIDSFSTINGAKQRKEIYEQFKLFENDQA